MKTKKLTFMEKSRRMLWKARYGVDLALCSGLVWLQQNVASAAATPAPADDYSFLQSGKSNGMFDKPLNVVKQGGRSAYQLVMAFSLVVLVVSLLAAAICYGFVKAPQKKQENKSHIGDILIAGCMIFGVFGIIGICASIGKAI